MTEVRDIEVKVVHGISVQCGAQTAISRGSSLTMWNEHGAWKRRQGCCSWIGCLSAIETRARRLAGDVEHGA